MTLTERPRYRGALVGALLCLAVGLALREAWILAMGAVPVAFLAFSAASGVPDPSIEVERTVEPDRAVPGERVRVTLRVRNAGETSLPDVRVVDSPPTELSVVDGDSAGAFTIPPAETERLSYTLRASRGDHAFERPRIRLRGVAGGSYREREPSVSGDDRLRCRLVVEEPPTRRETATLVGAVATTTGGSGVEFHTTRGYRPGDPIGRIDWRRLARTQELATVDYREHRGVSVVIVVDCRDGVQSSPAGTVTDRCRYASDRLLAAFAEENHQVGLTVLGTEPMPWVAPGSSDVVARGRAALQSVDGTLAWDGPQLHRPARGDESIVDRLAGRLPTHTQLLVITPLGDDLPITAAREFGVRGHAVTVLTPEPDEPAGRLDRLAAAERRTRRVRLRDAGARLIDWPRGESLAVAVEAAGGRR